MISRQHHYCFLLAVLQLISLLLHIGRHHIGEYQAFGDLPPSTLSIYWHPNIQPNFGFTASIRTSF
ncbi:hypothetical protein GYMLUDRAFT_789055 [Collybiopsis luxurians FD-317 M1]|nr:hypothetical protein GYMLUDRAFT_789055 [Collybiopsis luxurians FD-317 M1]